MFFSDVMSKFRPTGDAVGQMTAWVRSGKTARGLGRPAARISSACSSQRVGSDSAERRTQCSMHKPVHEEFVEFSFVIQMVELSVWGRSSTRGEVGSTRACRSGGDCGLRIPVAAASRARTTVPQADASVTCQKQRSPEM